MSINSGITGLPHESTCGIHFINRIKAMVMFYSVRYIKTCTGFLMNYQETLSQFIQPCKSRGFQLYEGMWKKFEGIVLVHF